MAITKQRVEEIISRIEMYGHGAGYTVEEVYDLAVLALNLSNIAKLKRYELDMDGCDSFGQDCGADMTEDSDGDYVLFDDVVKLFEFDTTTQKLESTERRQPVSEIDYQALRDKAEKATWGDWDSYKPHRGARGYEVRLSSQAIAQHVLKNNAEFIAAFNPKVALALLDEWERNQQYIKRRDQENEDIALTVGKLRVELEGKDSKIANLTAERDALREGEMGDARHSNTRAAADIYFQLVEECEIPAGGSLVEYVDDMREKLEAAEKRIAELESDSQAQKLVEAIIVAIENEQERLFDEDYLMDSKECIDVIREEVKRWNDSRTAGIRIKGE